MCYREAETRVDYRARGCFGVGLWLFNDSFFIFFLIKMMVPNEDILSRIKAQPLIKTFNTYFKVKYGYRNTGIQTTEAQKN